MASDPPQSLPYMPVLRTIRLWSEVKIFAYEPRDFTSEFGTYGLSSFTPEEADRARDALVRASAFESGAIEQLYQSHAGATVSVAREFSGWKNELRAAGPSAEDAFNDHMAAYRLAQEFAENNDGFPINEAFIRQIHEVATASQKYYDVETSTGKQQHALSHGTYKSDENFVVDRFGTKHAYSSPLDVATEMDHFIQGFRDLPGWYAQNNNGNELPPLIAASYLHWGLTHIHPFDDGNGRVARIVASIPILPKYWVPFLVYADRKQVYFQALEAADAGNLVELISYFSSRVKDAQSWLENILYEVSHSSVAETLDEIEALLQMQTEDVVPTDQIAEGVASALLNKISASVTERFEKSSVRYDVASTGWPTAGGYERTGIAPISFSLKIEGKLKSKVETTILISYSTSIRAGQPAIHLEYQIGSDTFSKSEMHFHIEECSPDLSTEANARLDAFVESLIARMTARLMLELRGEASAHGKAPSS
jgi:Fic family protein